ncbi:MAG: type IV toxin-antitoxin system AbiEi family antitoxin domain-containing protein [Deltaproteobacteria bacterium]|nr:type IV toxin-antitoxin system AbiEi family antitoxin domain-containing protein [Deltaproteobacteria bacterium]
MNNSEVTPDWNVLYETASAQDGYFTTRQAAEAGYSTQLLLKHIHAGRVVRSRRGIYRLVHFPAGDYEELVIAWLWSEQTGIVSHETALALHGLSDVLPAKVHLTLPLSWKNRRFRVPENIVLHYFDVSANDRAWFGAVPTTGPGRTLNDCALENLSPDLLQQAAQQALKRGVATVDELTDVKEYLRGFGGLNI